MIVYKNQIAREHNNIMDLLTEMIAYIQQNTKLHVHTVNSQWSTTCIVWTHNHYKAASYFGSSISTAVCARHSSLCWLSSGSASPLSVPSLFCSPSSSPCPPEPVTLVIADVHCSSPPLSLPWTTCNTGPWLGSECNRGDGWCDFWWSWSCWNTTMHRNKHLASSNFITKIL